MIYKVYVLLPTIVVSDGIVGIAWLGKFLAGDMERTRKRARMCP